MKDVSEYLKQRGVSGAKPGAAKLRCPECRKHTLTVKKNNEIAKCFHPDCMKVFGAEQSHKSIAFDSLTQIADEAHRQFLQRKGAAWDWLVGKRNIHEDVIRDSGVGVVYPTMHTHVETVFCGAIEEIRERIQKLKKGRGWKEREALLHAAIENLEERTDKLSGLLFNAKHNASFVAGWLVFPHRNASGQVVSLKFRNTIEKDFRFFSMGGESNGVFGLEIFSNEGWGADDLIVTEGEINVLRLQSVLKELGADYTAAAAFGGASSPDTSTIYRTCRRPTLFVDADDAGEGAVEIFRQDGSLYVVRSPSEGEDLEDYLNAYPTPEAAFDALKQAVSERTFLSRNFDGVREEVFELRRSSGKKSFDVNFEVANFIMGQLQDRGRLLCSRAGDPYFFDEVDHRLYRLDASNFAKGVALETDELLSRFGLNRSETTMNYVLTHLAAEARKDGERVDLHQLMWYNSETNTIYWSDCRQSMYRIREDGHDLVPNGTDGVMFNPPQWAEGWDYTPPSQREPGLLQSLLFEGVRFDEESMMTPGQTRMLVELWLLSMFFGSIVPTRPILLFQGEKGSAKSSVLKKLGHLLYGGDYDVTSLPSKQDDAEAIFTNHFLVGLDNVDGFHGWLDDLLATASTGGQVTKRKLYTTNTAEAFAYDCFVGITSRTPRFRRDDVSDRLLIVRLNRVVDGSGCEWVPPGMLQERTARLRNDVCSELLDRLRGLLPTVRTTANTTINSPIRMADFGSFSRRCGRAAGNEDEVVEALRAAGRAQQFFNLEDDILPGLLKRWLDSVAKFEDGAGTAALSTEDVYRALKQLAENDHLDWPWKSVSSFGKHLAQSLQNLKLFGIEGEKTVLNGYKKYRFKRSAK